MARPRGEAEISAIATRVGRINNRVNEKQVALIVYQHITIYSVKDIMKAVGVVLTSINSTESQTEKLLVDFFPCSYPRISNEGLN